MALTGYDTIERAEAANTCGGYRTEVIDMAAPFGGSPAGTGYALLARHGRDSRSPIGAGDARLHLAYGWIDGPEDIARALGLD